MPDLRDALRALRATPVVSSVAILSLALGIGANTAIFSIVNTLMLRSLPVRQPQQIVQLMTGPERTSWSNPLWEELRDRHAFLFDGAFAYSTPRFDLARGGEAQFVNGMMASGGAFGVLGVPAILGRTFSAAEDVPGGGKDGPVAVITYAFWQRQFGGAASVVGQHISLDRVDFTIIGVTPPEFTGLDQGTKLDVAVPLGVEPLIRGNGESAMKQRSWWWLRVIARLRPGQTTDQAVVAFRGIQPQMRTATVPPTMRPQDIPRYLKDPFNARIASNGPNSLGRTYQQPLTILMGVVALVLVIACANIANLQMARASGRRHELSVRIALGASSWRVARHLLAESALLSASGAILGLAFARWAARALVAQLSLYGSRIALDVALDWRVLAFTAGVAITTTFLFGIVPALRGTRVDPGEAIKAQGRSIVGDSRLGIGSWLVVAQVALSLVLVVGAGLFVRTFAGLAGVRLGFDTESVLVVDANAKNSSVMPAARSELWRRMREAALSVPGVRSAALESVTPMTNSEWNTLIDNPPGLSLAEKDREVYVNSISAGWFATHGTPILAGRDFTAQDTLTAPRVILVNETLVKKYFPNTNPLGRWIRNVPYPGENPPQLFIIGVVRDSVYDSLRTAIPPTMYQHYLQREKPGPSMSVAVRAGAGSPALLTRSVAEAIGRVDRDVTLSFHSLSDDVRDATVQERVLALLSAFFGGLALLLAGLGLYGVMSYAVTRRRTEIGIRMALGAGPSGAVRLILLRVAALVGLGVVCGGALSLWAARFVSTLLFGLQPRDPATLTTAAVVLLIIGGLAGWIPARRASRIDPAQVLRM
jgi:putative ABC transport system permease protein